MYRLDGLSVSGVGSGRFYGVIAWGRFNGFKSALSNLLPPTWHNTILFDLVDLCANRFRLSLLFPIRRWVSAFMMVERPVRNGDDDLLFFRGNCIDRIMMDSSVRRSNDAVASSKIICVGCATMHVQ